jgi:hypothetical protein
MDNQSAAVSNGQATGWFLPLSQWLGQLFGNAA